MKKVFVTGGTGFIGQALIKRLLADGWQVTALARSKEKVKKTGLKNINWCFGDIRSTSWHQFVQGANVFIHLVGVHGFRQISFKERLSIEFEGTKSAIQAVKKAKVPFFVHMSTAFINMETEYAKAKRVTQKWVEEEIKKGFPAAIICPVTVYGPEDFSNLYRLFLAVSRGKFFFVGSGKNTWQFLYIDDLIDFLIRLVKKGTKAKGKIFVLAGESISLEKLVRIISQEEKVAEPKIHLPKRLMFLTGTFFSFLSKFKLPVPFTFDTIQMMIGEQKYHLSKAAEAFGFKIKTDLATGIKKTVKWYREKKVT